MTAERGAMKSWGTVFEPIPRVLHQTWKSPQVPPHWQRYRESWVAHHESWTFRLWTDEDNRELIASRYPWFLPVYDAFPRQIQRVDAAKYFILYTYGGVYADLDCQSMRPLDPVIERGGAILGHSGNGVIECAVFASPPRHPLWELAFEEMPKRSLGARFFRGLRGIDAIHVLFRTGPFMLRRIVRRYRAEAIRRADSAGLTLCRSYVFSSRSWWRRDEEFQDPRAYVRHHHSDSWLRPEESGIIRPFTIRRLVRVAAIATLAVLAVSLASLLM